jgi:ankyrin repeat protein
MLTFLKSGRNRKLTQAISHGDLDTLAKLLRHYDADTLNELRLENGLSAGEIAIKSGQAKALELLLARGLNANGPTVDGTPLLHRALTHPDQSLALITPLLKAGASATDPQLLTLCATHCPPDKLMMHLSRLIEFGASLEHAHELVQLALEQARQDLVHFLINSGAPLPDPAEPLNCSADILAYARRCAEDRRIRAMMQGF